MLRRMIMTFGVLLILGGGGHALAQDQSSGSQPPPTREQLETQVSILQEYIKRLEAQKAASSDDVDAAVLKAYKEAQVKQYESMVTQADLVNQAFYEQRFISRISLALVALVVVAGVTFSAMQLWQTIKVAGSPLSNDVEISASRIKLTTSVIGLIVLAISLAFFYVFFTINLRVERAGSSTPVSTTAQNSVPTVAQSSLK